MLHSMKLLNGFHVGTTDGDFGKIKDLFFDDEKWAIRYLVMTTGGWLSGRDVLIPTHAVDQVEWTTRTVHLSLTKEQISNSPDVDCDKPVHRQHEASLAAHYGYPFYWAGPMVWGTAAYPFMTAPALHTPAMQPQPGAGAGNGNDDPHLRSISEVIGYGIEARDGGVGQVDDFMFDDEDWTVAVMVVDTRTWWPGKHVLLPLRAIDHVSWEDQAVFVDAERETVKQSPELEANQTELSYRELSRAMRHAGPITTEGLRHRP